jgi:subtilisin-like proprotein convertase family protein
MIIKHIFFVGLLAALVLFSGGADVIAASTQTTSYSTALAIPDHNANGVADTELISFPDAISIDSLQVTLTISGGWNGDYYAYLKHGASGFSVLLNRAGVTGTSPYGYGDSGFNLTLSDAAPNGDVHFYQNVFNPNGSSLTGTWQPDGRNVDPDVVTGSSSRDAMLNSFAGLDPNGSWTLFVADDSAGGIGTLTGWGLSITAETVPEPGAVGLLGIGFGLALFRQGRNRR